MKNLLIIFIAFLLSSCGDDIYVRKSLSVENNETQITLKWYYYSYYQNYSPDFIDIIKGDSIVNIYNAMYIITDVYVSYDDSTIIIKTFKPSNGIIYTKKLLPEVFGFKIAVDTTATYNELRNIPNGIEE